MEQEQSDKTESACAICDRQRLKAATYARPEYETVKRANKSAVDMRLENASNGTYRARVCTSYSKGASCGCVVRKTNSLSVRKTVGAGYAHSENSSSTSTTTYGGHFATCSCCERRPRDRERQLYISADWNVYSSYRVEDYTKMYRRADDFYDKRRCACKINYQIPESTPKLLPNAWSSCQCQMCAAKKLACTCPKDVDECDGKKYENVKPEPKYENVDRRVDKSPKYENLEEITRLHGDRLGPEGQNLEDEVQYENVPPSSSFKSKSADSKNLSVSAGNLASGDVVRYNSKEFVPPDFFSNNRSGTFPQYLQKEVKEVGLDGLKMSAKDVTQTVQPLINNSKRHVKKIAKKEMCEVKQARLWVAQDEYRHLNNALAALDTSRTSLCSSGSGGSARYDPELLRSDVALAKERVARLQKELQQARTELTCTQQGVETLHSVEQKMSSRPGCYNITEVQAMMTEMENIQKSLISGEKEKAKLRQSLAKLKDDFTRLQLEDVSPETSTLSLPQEKLSTASQTDLCNDLPIGTRLAEITRMRLKYDESRKKIQLIQQQLVDLEDKVQPGQAESDKDRLLLCQEKEQLLRELKSITLGGRSKQEMSNIQLECKRLEQELNNEVEISNRCIADRLRLHEEKQLLLQQLKDALKTMTTLESQLKNLSASTLSVSSSSSLGSLSTTSSKGSLSSGLSFTDIYGGPQCINGPLTIDKPIDMVDLRRRAERLLVSSSGSVLATGSGSQPSLSPRSSLSSVAPSLSPPVSPPVARPPSYNLLSQSLKRLNEDQIAEMRNLDLTNMDGINMANYASRLFSAYEKMSDSRQDPPLSPISETPPPLTIEQELLQSTSGALSGTPTSSGTSRSVSAAVSDESVAGDSGVFEASCRLRNSNHSAPTETTAQVQIKLQYSIEEQTLYVIVQKIRNLQALSLKEDDSVYIRALLLPSVREAGAPLPVPLRLPLPLPAAALKLQTLRLQACRRLQCLGLVQVSLADFSCDTVSVKWYNILSLQNSDKIDEQGLISLSCREESSDESTLISSQTSTLTRSQGNEGIQLPLAVESPRSSDDEEDEEEEEEENDEQVNDILKEFYLECTDDVPQILNETQEVPLSSVTCTEEKETNTDCNFYTDRRIAALLPNDERLSIKRSRTFSPTPQFGKNQYICRLNRSESDSSMPLYRRGACSVTTFDRHAVVRRSLRRGTRVPGLPGTLPGRSASTRTSHTPRTSLDLELDLRAHQRRWDMLSQEITRLQDLKKRLEVAREKGNSTVANWAVEDESFAQLCNDNLAITGVGSSGIGTAGISSNDRAERRAARALQKTCRDLYRLRRTKQPRGAPDMITFKEKMAFFTHYQPNIPILPCEDLEHSTEPFFNGQLSVQICQLSQIFGELDCETTDAVDRDANSSKDVLNDITKNKLNHSDITNSSGGLSDIQVGYQVRRSGRCKNVIDSVDTVGNIIVVKENSDCLEKEDDESLQSGDISEDKVSMNVNKLNSVVKTNDKEQNGEENVNSEENARYQYVVDRDLGVQV